MSVFWRLVSTVGAVGLCALAGVSSGTSSPGPTGSVVRGTPPHRSVTVQHDIRYRIADGQPLLLDAYLPTPRSGRAPGVIFIHGGGWTSGDKADLAPEAETVASLGWVAFSIDYRLEPPAAFPAAIDDTLAAVRWIRARAGRFGVDPRRLAVFGPSAGGNLAAVAATRGSGSRTVGSRVAAAVSWSGPMDLAAMAEGALGGAAAVRRYVGCLPSECSDRYQAASPISSIDRSDAPIFLANSQYELVPLAQAQEMSSLLAGAHVPHQLVVVPGGRHARAYEPAVWANSLRFLERWLGKLPVQDLAPPGR